MAIINALIPSASADVVAIFPEASTIRIPGAPSIFDIPGFIPVQVFADARPMRAQISEPSRYMAHPLEDGAQVTDHRIILPTEISISFILRPESYRVTYQLIKQAYLAAVRFAVQTKTDTYTGMYISDIPHEEDPALFDTVTMIIQFREVQFFAAQIQALSGSDVLDALDGSTVDRGEQSATGAGADPGSTLFRVFGGLL